VLLPEPLLLPPEVPLPGVLMPDPEPPLLLPDPPVPAEPLPELLL
jgi:hypothetical protein